MGIKKILLNILLLVIAFTTTACNEKEKVIEPVNIHILLSFPGVDAARTQLYLDTAENFHKLNPLINVTIDQPLGNNLLQPDELTNRLNSNEVPDIVPYAPEGELWDLQQLFEPKGIDINQRLLDSTLINGKLLSLPYSVDPYLVLFNKNLFDEAHIPYPKGDWTWEQFRDISKKLKPKTRSVLPYDLDTLGILMKTTGKGLLSPSGDTFVGYLDSAEAIRTIQWLNAYYHDDVEKTAPMNFMDSWEKFSSFQAGMYVGNYNDYTAGMHNLNFGDTIGVAPLPHFEGGNRASPMNLQGFGITKKSKHPQEAWKFLEYLILTKHDNTNKMADYYLTPSKSMSETTGQSSDPIKSIFLDEINYGYSFIGYGGWNEDLTTQFQKLLVTNDKDIPDKLHDLALKLDQEMNRLKNAEDQKTESSSK